MKANRQLKDLRIDATPAGYLGTAQWRPSEMVTGVLWVVIPYTTPDLTGAALRHAAVCTDLDLHVCLVDIQVVPFPCPLSQPPVDKKFSEIRLQALLKESGLTGKVAIVYSRDRIEAFEKVLEPGSLVIMATRKRWWPTRETRLARALTKAGHQVMLLPVVR